MSEIIKEEDDQENPVHFRVVLTGYSYQLKLLLLFLCRGWRNGYVFKLQTEIEAAEKFDDLIFYYKKKGEEKFHAICLQAKHCGFKGAELEYSSFVNSCKKKVCNLKKYFISFQSIKRNFAVSERPKTYILCNNYILPTVLKKNANDKDEDALMFEKANMLDDIFFDNTVDTTDDNKIVKNIWPQHKLAKANKELMEMLKNESDISSLAKGLLTLIIKNEIKGGENCVEINLNEYYLSLFRDALFNDGIFEVKDIVKFKQSFIDGKNLNNKPYFINLKKYFELEFTKIYCGIEELKNIQLNEDFIDIFKEAKNDGVKDLTEEELRTFAADLMECIIDQKNPKLKNLVKENSAILKDILYCERRIVFSDRFIKNEFANPNIKFFRKTILESYKKYLIKLIPNFTIYLEDDAQNPHHRSTEIEAAELAKLFFYRKRISSNVVSACQKMFNRTILQHSGAKNVKFAENIFCTSEKEKYLYEFLQKFLEFYVMENLKNQGFSLKLQKDEEAKKVANQIIQDDGELFEFNKNHHFSEALFEYACEFVPHSVSKFKFRPSFFQTKPFELPEEIKNFQEEINENILMHTYETLKLSQIQNDDVQEGVALPENKDKKRILLGKFADEITEMFFGPHVQNLNNLYVYNWENYKNKETKGCINALKEDIFTINENDMLTFKNAFFINKGLSATAKIFKQQLEERIKKRWIDILSKKHFNIKKNCMPLYCRAENMERLAISLITAKNQTMAVNEEIKKLISDLAGIVFVSTGESNKVRFSNSFLNDGEWSCEAEYVKEALTKTLQIREFKNLKNWTIEIDKNKVKPKTNITYYEAQIIAEDIKNAVKTPNNNEKYVPKKPEFHTIVKMFEGTVFEKSDDDNKFIFIDSFFKDHKWSKCGDIFRRCLKKYLPDNSFDNLKSFEISIVGFPFCCDTLIENGNIEDDIEEFRQNLLIATTPGETDLLEIVDKELGNEFKLLNTNAYTTELFTKIIEWSKKIDGRALTEKETKTFFDDIKSNISSLMSAGINSLYCEKLKRNRIHFRNIESVSWKRFFVNEQKQFLLLTSNLMKLTEIKVLQFLQELSFLINLDSIIFQNLSSLLLMEKFVDNTLSSALSSNLSHNLIVIVDDAVTQNVWRFYDFLKTINNCILNNSKKKLILITYETSEILKMMKLQVSAEKILPEKDVNQFQDLSKKSQKRFLKKKVTFQGKVIHLNKIINDHKFYDNFLDVETMKKLITNRNLNIAKLHSSFKGCNPKSYYPRRIGLLKTDQKLFEITEKFKKHLFVFNGINALTLNNLLKSYEIDISKACNAREFIKCDFQPEWRYIAFESKTEEEVAEYLDQIKLKYPKSQIHSFLVVNSKNEIYVDEEFFAKYISHENVVIITDSAGMGKSTILTKLEQEMKELNAQKWIIRINLSHYTSFFLKLKKNERSPEDDRFVFNFDNFEGDYGGCILNVLRKSEKFVEANKTFENHIFDYLFKNSKMLIIFDGFDEIGAHYRSVLMSWILRLKNKSKNQIWITSRSNFQSHLEENLGAIGFSLKPLTKKEQQKMLFIIWRNKWKGKLSQSQKFHILQYIETLIFEFPKSLMTTQNIVGSPLHTMMLAKMFKRNKEIEKDFKRCEINWVGCFDFIRLTSTCKNYKDDIISDCDCFHLYDAGGPLKNLFNLYDKFVEKKILKHFVEEKKIVASVQEAALKIKKQILIDYHYVHSMLGLIAMTDRASELLDEREKEKIKTFSAEFKTGDYNAGLVDDIVEKNNQPIFVHLTYAEYFSACFLIEKLNSVPEKKDTIFNIIGSILKSDAPVFSYCIKYLMVHKCENYDIGNILKDINAANFASTLEHYNCVKWILNDDDNFEYKFPKADSKSKTHLHYAVECGNANIIVYILLQTYTLIMKNDLQKRQSMISTSSLPFNAKESAVFFLSEFVNLFDNEGKTAVMYSKDANVTTLLNEVVDIGQRQKTSDIYSNDIIKILEQISKMTASNDLSEILNGSTYSPNIFTNLFSKLSVNSILTILNNVEPMFLKFMLEEDEDGFNFLATHFLRNDLTCFEKIKIIECYCWSVKNSPKDAILSHFVDAVVSIDSLDDFKELLEIAEKSSIEFPLDGSFLIACQYGAYDILRFILPTLTNEPKYENLNPFCYSLKNGAPLDILELIYQQTNPEINQKGGRGDTALTLAISFCFKLPIIRYLLQKGADPNISGSEKINFQNVLDNFVEYLKPVPLLNVQSCVQTPTPWSCALIRKDDEIIKCFLENSIILESEICIETMKSFYEDSNFDINFKSDGTPRLIEAICLKDESLIEFLLFKKSDVNVEDKTGKFPLHYACEKILHNCVKKLLKAGAYFDKADNEGKTPINYCEENSEAKKYLEFATSIFEIEDVTSDSSLFKSPYFSLSLTNHSKQTLKHIFAKKGSSFILKKADKKDINQQDFLGNTALHYAAENGHFSILTSLLLNGAFYDCENHNQKTPQLLAEENGHQNLSNLLTKINEVFSAASGGDILLFTKTNEELHRISNNAFGEFKIHSLRNKDAKSVIYQALSSQSQEIVQNLLKYLYVPDIEDQDLHYPAIKNNNLPMIKLLLKHKIPYYNKRYDNFKKDCNKNECILLFDKINSLFDCIYEDDYTALKHIFETENFELDIVEIANMTDQNKKTLFEYVQETTNYDLIFYLRKNGAAYTDINLSKNKKVRRILLDTKNSLDKSPTTIDKFMNFFETLGGGDFIRNEVFNTFKFVSENEDIFGEDVEVKKLLHMLQ